ncbi:MAG TPA: DUF2282 domain-containing protein [Aquabacterium sp.]|uniref:BufA1 family periplasmic bufferin-type metallophore n=1 Tax=Aquabacterium sp. TaxID=1872578 RepID=UPI002E32EB45|nr:DUF2282 domain-containing protein [Aquabacterium sp.]HEX5371213.1 DUF2282 domain-containing protein [Aquabacterium sp.]
MNKHQQQLSAALATVMALGLTTGARAHDVDAPAGKEKCYGAVKAGQNSCANLTGTHACAGLATRDKDPAEWTLVPKGSCHKLGGLDIDQARAAIRQTTPRASTPTGK